MRAILFLMLAVFTTGCAASHVLVKKAECQDIEGTDLSNCRVIHKL